MAARVEADFWRRSPAPQFLLNQSQILAANDAALELFGYAAEDLVERAGWEELLFANLAQFYKFHRFCFDSRGRSVDVEMKTREGRPLYVRALRRPAAEAGEYHVSFADYTELHEDSLVYQAGYDEFMKVTTELENALSVIEKQNQTLARQKDTLKNELAIAHKVQSQLHSEDFTRFKIVNAAGFYATMADLGGDTWDFFENDAEFYGAIGDVMGHGVAASLIGIAARTIFKKTFTDMANFRRSVADAANQMNAEFYEITRGNYYVTLCMVRIDRKGVMEYATFGHPPLFVVSANGETGRQIYTSQPMMGIFNNITYVSETLQLQPHDRVLMYTDCLLESLDPAGNPLKLDDVSDMLRHRPDNSPTAALDKILKFRRDHAQSDELPDDLALALLEYPG